MRTVVLVGIALAISACSPKMEDGSRPSEDDMRQMTSTDIGFGATAAILRDGTDGCDYISVDGNSANAARPRRAAGGRVVCGGPASGLAVVSAGDAPGIEIVRLRDHDTGCLWLWIDGNESGELVEVVGRNGEQVCR